MSIVQTFRSLIIRRGHSRTLILTPRLSEISDEPQSHPNLLSSRLTTLLVYLFSFVGMVIYTFTFRFGKIEVIYVTASLLG